MSTATLKVVRIVAPVAALGLVATLLWWGNAAQQPVSQRSMVAVGSGNAVEVPLNTPPFDRRDAIYVVATVRWGQTGAGEQEPSTSRAAQIGWDGYAALDCGSIEDADALGLEPLVAKTTGAAGAGGDRLGPVVRADNGDARVYWRSSTRGDWDGVRLHIAACKAGPGHETGATLRIVTPRKSWLARLDANLEAFVSVPAGKEAAIDVHLATVKDVEALQRARISQAPNTGSRNALLAIDDEPKPDHPVPHL